jgi:hypothetical protein
VRVRGFVTVVGLRVAGTHAATCIYAGVYVGRWGIWCNAGIRFIAGVHVYAL